LANFSLIQLIIRAEVVAVNHKMLTLVVNNYVYSKKVDVKRFTELFNELTGKIFIKPRLIAVVVEFLRLKWKFTFNIFKFKSLGAVHYRIVWNRLF